MSFLKDIEVSINGKPYIVLHNRAKSIIDKFTNKKTKIELSLSDEKQYALATVIIFE